MYKVCFLNQFATYKDPVLMIPITYCIGTSGAPIEILPGFGDENLLIGKLQLAVQVSGSHSANILCLQKKLFTVQFITKYF